MTVDIRGRQHLGEARTHDVGLVCGALVALVRGLTSRIRQRGEVVTPDEGVDRAASSGEWNYGELCAQVSTCLRERLRMDIEIDELDDLSAFLLTSHLEGENFRLVVASDLPHSERLHTYLHAAAHVMLGHADGRYEIILEPRESAGGRQIQLPEQAVTEHLEAEALTREMLTKSLDTVLPSIR